MNPPPASTYRLQFNSAFRFVDGRNLVPYLSDLGITDLYSSPRYLTRRGSSHGYDIANPLRVNSELGTEEDFDEMAGKLRHYGMGLVLDTVPNHMAASYENPWWTDVLENGESSAYAGFFDIDWHPPVTKAAFLQDRRVLLPVLDDLYGNVLASGRISLKIEDTGMHVRLHETRLPLDPKSYVAVLQRCPSLNKLAHVIRGLDHLPDRHETAADRIMERRHDKDQWKAEIWSLYQSDHEIRREIDTALLEIEGSVEDLDALLAKQVYRLAYWKIGYEEINYRRFFDINDLVGIRIEQADVFDKRYQKTLELIKSGKVGGLRIDHIDGLWDPECFLRRLVARVPGMSFLVVEKILGRDEELPEEWPVQGTTGYDFLNALNGVFIQPEGLVRLEETYDRLTENRLPFAEVCYQANKAIMQTLFTGDINAIGRHLGRLAARHRQARDIRLSELLDALVEVTACLPVYRTYIHDSEISPRDRAYIESTISLARRRTSEENISNGAFDFLRSVLLLDPPHYLNNQKREWLAFVMRWQQFTGPVMAKGLEDTVSYRHAGLISMNEVGGDPLRERPPFTLEEFHEFNQRRLSGWPATMSATATHDTKRGEDVRARVNVLTEAPEEWERRLGQWIEWNSPRKALVNGLPAPSPAEEVLIYQTMLGAWPLSENEAATFSVRLKDFMVKALREGKLHSSWIAPHEEYERAVQDFVDGILAAGSPFLTDFLEFQRFLAVHGARNGLAQVVLKIASPGVPDFYQGTELWQLSLVDPDNRRPVDFAQRVAMLDNLRRRESEDAIGLIRELAANPVADEIKLFVTWKALQFRRENRDLFSKGAYLPVVVRGPRARNVVAFCRALEDHWAMVVAPRWTSQIGDWEDTELVLPDSAPGTWEDVLTRLTTPSLRMRDVLAEFPVAMLRNA